MRTPRLAITAALACTPLLLAGSDATGARTGRHAVGWGEGEALTFDVRIAGLPAARASIAIGRRRGHTVVARGLGETLPLVRAFYDMAEEVTSVIDLRGLRPRVTRARRHVQAKRRQTVTRFGNPTRQVITRGKRRSQRVHAGPRPYDVLTALLLLRSLPLPDGFRTSLRVIAGTSLYRASLRVVRREVIALPDGGTRRAIRIEGMGRRIANDGSPLPRRKPRPFAIWFSDDGRRVPLRMEGGTRLGRVSADLASYRAPRKRLVVSLARPRVCPGRGAPRGWHRLARPARCGARAQALPRLTLVKAVAATARPSEAGH